MININDQSKLNVPASNYTINNPPVLNNARTSIADDESLNVESAEHAFKTKNSIAISQNIVIKSIGKNVVDEKDRSNEVNKVSEDESDSIFDIDKVVTTVMEFISASIFKAKERGVSEDKINDMFEQAKNGVSLGIEQAVDELKELTMLDKSLQTSIDQSEKRLNSEVDKLRSTYFLKEKKSKPDLENVHNISELSLKRKDNSQMTLTMFLNSNKEIGFNTEARFSIDEQEKLHIFMRDAKSFQQNFFDQEINRVFESLEKQDIFKSKIGQLSFESGNSVFARKYHEIATSEQSKEKKPSVLSEIERAVDFSKKLNKLRGHSDEFFSNDKTTFLRLLGAVYNAEFGDGNKSKNIYLDIVDGLINN